jgi:hypothetical protein
MIHITKKRNVYSIIAIFLITIIYVWQIVNTSKYLHPKSVIANDIVSYYAYLPIAFIEKDLKMQFLSNPNKNSNSIYWPEKAPNDALVIKTSMGMSMMYSPFFFMAHCFAEKLGYEADGFTTPYAFGIVFGCVVYLFIGFFFLRAVLLKYFNDIVVAFTFLLIGFATNLYWYATIEAPMSHAYSFSLFCIFLYLTERWQEKQKWITSIFIGLVIGLITLIRPTNGLIIILFLLYNIINQKDIRVRIQLFLTNYAKIIVMMICALIIWTPQLMYWKFVSGEWFFYSYGTERFFFNEPKIIDILFSFRKGWLLYTPVMIFAIIGIGLLWKINKKYFYPILIFSLINLYIVSSWWCWWYGGSFGMRSFIESYAILAIPLAVFLTWISKQKRIVKISLSVVVLAISLQSIFHTIQYYYGSIHWDSMTKQAYRNSFWHVRPTEEFQSLLMTPDYEAAKKGKR